MLVCMLLALKVGKFVSPWIEYLLVIKLKIVSNIIFLLFFSRLLHVLPNVPMYLHTEQIGCRSQWSIIDLYSLVVTRINHKVNQMVGDAQLVRTRDRVLQVLRFCRGYPHSVDDISHLRCAVATYQKNFKITRKLYFK